jgi:hypothetical protein
MNFTAVIAVAIGVLMGAAATTTTRSRWMRSIKKRLFGSRKRSIVTVGLVIALVGAGSALAAWLISASGAGTGKIGSLQTPTVAAGSPPPSSVLLPGSTGDARFSVTNPNSVDLVVTSVTDPDAELAQFEGPGACSQSNVTVQPKSGLSIVVPKNATTTITIPDAYKLSSQAETTCQGQSFTKKATLSFSTP